MLTDSLLVSQFIVLVLSWCFPANNANVNHGHVCHRHVLNLDTLSLSWIFSKLFLAADVIFLSFSNDLNSRITYIHYLAHSPIGAFQ